MVLRDETDWGLLDSILHCIIRLIKSNVLSSTVHIVFSLLARTINTLLLNELPQFNGLALQMIWSMLGTFSCLHKDLASDMEQLFQSFAQQVAHRLPTVT